MAEFDLPESLSEERLSRIGTHWSLLAQAKQGDTPDVRAAQAKILSRYWKAVVWYLFSILRDPDAVEDCSQEFALRFVRGDFRNLDPQRGRFRDFLRTSLMNLARDFLRRRVNELPKASFHSSLHSPADEVDDVSLRFEEAWRQEIVNKAWDELRQFEPASAVPYYLALRRKSENPQMRSADLARELSKEIGQDFTADSIRQILHRARLKFAELLYTEVSQSLGCPSHEDVVSELSELGLLKYCEQAIAKRTT